MRILHIPTGTYIALLNLKNHIYVILNNNENKVTKNEYDYIIRFISKCNNIEVLLYCNNTLQSKINATTFKACREEFLGIEI